MVIFIENDQIFVSAIINLGSKIRIPLLKIPKEISSKIYEICLRTNKNIVLETPEKSYFLNSDGSLSDVPNDNMILNSFDIQENLRNLCNFSVYMFQSQIKLGFLTLRGGHRVGICGTAIIVNKEIINISEVSSINLRISREVLGSSDKILEKLGENLGGTLIAGPPASGKTTILRDIARKLSTQNTNKITKIVIIDQRREIAACYQGSPQHDIGFSDVLSGFSKNVGIMQAIRTLSPNYIICDEIGTKSDVDAICECLNSGVGIIASAHAFTAEELTHSQRLNLIFKSGAFNNVVLLDSRNAPGNVKNIYGVENFYDKTSRSELTNVHGYSDI
ncbi:MAG: stage III sporulation protein AA [Candidatus Improbicoccus devescovinae]|nr:MAG: stage III sporulation protein AA [Candidatus Improbicoccus devescovinae]